MRSHTSCTSSRRWLHMMTVLPWARSSRMRFFIQRVPSGSRPEVGSSRMTRSGSLMRAWARPMRWRMPLEYSRRMRLRSALRPTFSMRSCAFASADAGRHVEEPAVEVERLLGVEEAVEVRFLGQVADALVLAHVGGGLAEDEGLAVGREEQAEKELDGGGLAGAVGAEEAEDLAAIDFHGEGAEGVLFATAPEVAVNLRQLAGFDDNVLSHGGASYQTADHTHRSYAVGRAKVRRPARGSL